MYFPFLHPTTIIRCSSFVTFLHNFLRVNDSHSTLHFCWAPLRGLRYFFILRFFLRLWEDAWVKCSFYHHHSTLSIMLFSFFTVFPARTPLGPFIITFHAFPKDILRTEAKPLKSFLETGALALSKNKVEADRTCYFLFISGPPRTAGMCHNDNCISHWIDL